MLIEITENLIWEKRHETYHYNVGDRYYVEPYVHNPNEYYQAINPTSEELRKAYSQYFWILKKHTKIINEDVFTLPENLFTI